jgi:hypothetical protein
VTESTLYPDHRGYLKARGVADDVIAERHVFSVPTKSALHTLGFGRNTPAPAMVMPLWDVVGACDGYQIRPDAPRVGTSGRALKFEVPHGFKPRLDVHPRTHPLLADPTVPLWFTEGVPKGDALVSVGQAAVVLLGVWNWTGDSLADFEYLRAKGRRIYVCFDSDVMLKQSVHAALGRLGALLARRGADVAYVYLPDDAQGRKQGVDDYLAAGGTVAELLAEHTTTELRTPAWDRPPTAEPRPKANQLALAGVVGVFKRWLEHPDLDALYAVLAAVIANRADGDPVWLLIVAPPSSGKTEVIMPLAVLDDVTVAGTLSPAALLSGTPKAERAADATGGLLRQVGDRGILVNKDFGTVLAMRHETRAEVMQALRDIYDGHYDRAIGSDGGRQLVWEGHCGFIAGCTPAIDEHHAVVAALGDRYVMLRLALTDETRQATRALDASGDEPAMRDALATAVAGILDHTAADLGDFVPGDVAYVADLAVLAVRCRSVVSRDGYTRDIISVPTPEQPARLAKQLGKLLKALRVIGVDDVTARRIVARCAIDSMPVGRRQCIEALMGRGQVSTTDIGDRIDLPSTTTRRLLEDLAAHHVVVRTVVGQGFADLWELAEFAAGRWPTSELAGGVPETSAPSATGCAHTHNAHTTGLGNEEEFSGTPPVPDSAPADDGWVTVS